jgi:hypothetical protein
VGYYFEIQHLFFEFTRARLAIAKNNKMIETLANFEPNKYLVA